MKVHETGFSLIELLVAILIVSILSALAYPSYLGQLRKSRRAEATTELVSLAQLQERFYARFRTYSSVVAAPGPCAGQACGLGQSSNLSESEYYVLAANGNATSYTLTATANGPQIEDTGCRTLTINSVGVKSGTSASGQDASDICW